MYNFYKFAHKFLTKYIFLNFCIMKYDVFISYSRKDKDIADKVCEAFDRNNISYFIDRKGIIGAAEFPTELAHAIVDSEIFLLLASENAYQSMFTNREIVFASNKKKGKNLLPYIIDNSELPLEIEFVFSSINWRNMSEHPIDTVLVEDILQMLGRDNFIKREDNFIKTKDSSTITKNEDTYLIPWQKDEQYGFIDKTGKFVIPCQWKKACEFSDGLAKVKNDKGEWEFIDKSGNIVIPCQWEFVRDFSENLAIVQNDDKKWGFIDKTSKIIVPGPWHYIYAFSEGLAGVENNDDGKWGFIDKLGKLVIPCQWQYANSFKNGVAQVSDVNHKNHLIDKQGNIII